MSATFPFDSTVTGSSANIASAARVARQIPAAPRLLFGQVMHRRLRPAHNAFIYPVFYIQLPLKDLMAARRALFSIDGFNVLSFRQRDHGPCDGSALLPWIQRVLRQHGLPDDGEIVLQAFPRVFGYVFNPVSFWFCRNREGELIAVLAEVSNTFGGRHHYFLHNPDGSPLREGQTIHADKSFHVSPFNNVTGAYRFRFQLREQRQIVRIDYADAEGDVLLTSISGSPGKWSSASLFCALARMPLLTLGVTTRIHWQALKLWCKRVPFVGARPPQQAPVVPHDSSITK